MKNALAIAILAVSFTSACLAQTSAPVPQNLLACSKVQDAAERVRCYDAQIAAMSSATATTPAPGATTAPSAAAASATAPAPRAPAPAASSATAPAPRASASVGASAAAATAASAPAAAESARAAQFGQEELPQAARPPRNKEDESLSSRITALNVVGANKYLISLENGQVWRQKESDHIASFFHVGDDVRIERGMLGSYRLWAVSAGEKNWIAVLRAR